MTYTPNISDRKAHIVAFDIPVPMNYGGAIDIFYKIKQLRKEGVAVVLHCFQYGREKAGILEEICEKVYYYPRNLSLFKLASSRPFIVKSRAAPALLQNLLADDNPVLFEGLHSCYFLNDPTLGGRRRIVRTHNIEHEYYASLASVESNPFRKLYFNMESRKLEQFETELAHATGIAAISRKDQQHFLRRFPATHVENICAFHPFDRVDIKEGLGKYALYHGSLEVGENNEAALFLIRGVFKGLSLPLYIAGNKPSKELIKTAARYSNVRLMTNLTTDDIYELVREAHINVLPTFQATGIKLKLLAALFTGRHCLVNLPMVENTGLESLCHIADDAAGMREIIHKLIELPFKREDVEQRSLILNTGSFSNPENAQKLCRLIFGQ